MRMGATPKEMIVGYDQANIIAHEKLCGKKLGSHPVVLIVEGFLLFYDSVLTNMLHAQLWIEVDCDTCLIRRCKRGRGTGH